MVNDLGSRFRPVEPARSTSREAVARFASGEEPRKISVVVADEHTLMCEGIAAICEQTPAFRVVGQCGDGLAALRMIESLAPQAGLLDLNLPKLHGLAVIRKLRLLDLPTKFLVLADQRDGKTVADALRSGASGFVLKNDRACHLVQALESVHSGSIYVSPQLKVTEIFTPRPSVKPRNSFEMLSPREHQVFCLLVQGLRAKEIATRLDLSPKTVDTYRSSLMRKLDIYDVAGLVKFAIRKNLTSLK